MHGQGKGDVVLSAQVSRPVPAKDTFHPYGNVLEVRENQLEKGFRVGFDIFVHFGFALLVQDADVHFASVQINAAVILMLLSVEYYRLASFG